MAPVAWTDLAMSMALVEEFFLLETRMNLNSTRGTLLKSMFILTTVPGRILGDPLYIEPYTHFSYLMFIY